MYSFGEKKTEYHAKYNEELPVWKSPKYEEAKRKAIEIIKSKQYGISEADFWILMNATKTKKMMYTGLIISHNGCLKINDCLDSKFKPECVMLDKEGYNGSLVFSYCNPEQGIYEVGEVSKTNCQNEYPYAMAYKRLFDRVVLKLSKLAYSGIYSDSESDEFTQRLEAAESVSGGSVGKDKEEAEKVITIYPEGFESDAELTPTCAECGVEISARVHDFSVKKYKKPLCMDCQKKCKVE